MKNFELRMLAYFLSENPEKFKDGGDGVTLIVNGMVVSGIMIPKPTFLEQGQNATLKAMISTLEKAANQSTDTNSEVVEEVEEDFDLENYTRIYLKNARYFVGANPIPANANNYAVINIDSVDAFNMGAMAPDN